MLWRMTPPRPGHRSSRRTHQNRRPSTKHAHPNFASRGAWYTPVNLNVNKPALRRLGRRAVTSGLRRAARIQATIDDMNQLAYQRSKIYAGGRVLSPPGARRAVSASQHVAAPKPRSDSLPHTIHAEGPLAPPSACTSTTHGLHYTIISVLQGLSLNEVSMYSLG
jgi:hypothetical protein